MSEGTEYFENIQDLYDKNSILSRCKDVVLEAKRVTLNEELEKIANITLATINSSKKTIEKVSKECRSQLDLKSDVFYEELPNPRQKYYKYIPEVLPESIENVEICISDLIQANTKKVNEDIENDKLIRKYFHKWTCFTRQHKNRVKFENKNDPINKLDNFIDKLKKWKQEEIVKKSEEKIEKVIKNKPISSYKNRFTAQKTIIDKQKAKLEEQNKIIEELKFGIIREDLLKSIENTKTNIREIFSGCSQKLKCRVPIILMQENRFNISTTKAPRILQKMEQRAIERERNREIILTRKRFLEETRQRLLEEAIEKKKILEEEERKRMLEMMKERRKKEMELERIRQVKKQQYMEQLNKAVTFYNKLLLKQCFIKLYNNLVRTRECTAIAAEYYKKKTLTKYLNCWMDFVEDIYSIKYDVADTHFANKIQKKAFKIWKEEHIENVRNMQVAEDLYDFRLTSNTFIHWHRHVCVEIMIVYKKMKIAEKHYDRRILFQYFYQWRSLKAVLELEKAKELKKRRWREKVWEILPDYKPPEDI